MTYAWIIDKDHIADPSAKPGTNINAVGPLWDFGEPSAGCSHIKYRSGNKWETL
jgi:hypothetical protein